MCWSCGCHALTEKHSPAAIDTSDMEAAADDAGTDVAHVVANMAVALGSFRAGASKASAAAVGCEVFKSTEELRYTLGVAYPATRPDVGKAADGYRDFARADTLRSAAWSYLRKGAAVGLDHAKGTDGAGTVVESYLWPEGAPDWPQPNGYVVKSGDWLLGVVWGPEAWADIKAGRRKGFSPQGGARRRTPSPEALSQLRS